MKKAVQHLQTIGRNDEYGTPHDLFDKACKDYDIYPEVDICASKENHVLKLYFPKDFDCFKYRIEVDFFMNPPISEIAKFMKFAREQHEKYNVNVMILAYAKVDTRWWHDYVEGRSEIHNIKGRIRFNCKHGYPKDNVAPYPSSWIIWRKRNVF